MTKTLTLLLLITICGCTSSTQRAKFEDPNGFTITLSVNKTSFLYWSKYQADTDTFGMTTKIYNAEEKPDSESVKAFVEGIVKGLMLVGDENTEQEK